MGTWEQDPVLRRFERDAVIACAAMAAGALIARRGDPDVAFGVLGGGALVGLSYRAIKDGIDGMLGAAPQRRTERRRAGWALVKFFTRYAILVLAAYVMLVRLRLHPLGMIAGASSLVVAAAGQAVRRSRQSTGDSR